MANVVPNPGYLRASAHDIETGEDTARFQDRWAYVASDGQTYTHPTEIGAQKMANREIEV